LIKPDRRARKINADKDIDAIIEGKIRVKKRMTQRGRKGLVGWKEYGIRNEIKTARPAGSS